MISIIDIHSPSWQSLPLRHEVVIRKHRGSPTFSQIYLLLEQYLRLHWLLDLDRDRVRMWSCRSNRPTSQKEGRKSSNPNPESVFPNTSGAEAKTSTPSLDLDDSPFLAVLNAESKAQYVVAGRKIKSFDQMQT